MAGNLEFIKSASGTSVSSLSVTDCFSADYDVYFFSADVIKDNITSGNRLLEMRFIDSGGSVISASEYDYANLNLRPYDVFTEARVTNTNGIQRLALYSNIDKGTGTTGYIFNPYNSSSYTFATYQSSGTFGSAGGYGGKSIGVHKVAEQITGLNFYPNADSFDLTVNVYGVK